jgi:hypothetical protein
MKRKSFLVTVLGAAVALSVAVGVAAGPASMNCNNPSFCGPDLGGFWGWAVFNTDGTADAELTGCGHLAGGPGGGGGGAQHFSADAESWFIGPNGNFWVDDETDTYVGDGRPVTVPVPGPQDTGIPAAPGHYNTSELLGFTPPPGVASRSRSWESRIARAVVCHGGGETASPVTRLPR